MNDGSNTFVVTIEIVCGMIVSLGGTPFSIE